ncbi:hypothetical protein BJ322DRAFT_1017731 [Thelephora terrestris]|uniref:Uncharacterized protein n=1 Tax=Thelephora terrestris TaxID=56493 RepID=A0A9P6HN81_9AGAM|nr:hypothetical protein BJ322DRAFT_1017731 [Thelephora terrestris]
MRLFPVTPDTRANRDNSFQTPNVQTKSENATEHASDRAADAKGPTPWLLFWPARKHKPSDEPLSPVILGGIPASQIRKVPTIHSTHHKVSCKNVWKLLLRRVGRASPRPRDVPHLQVEVHRETYCDSGWDDDSLQKPLGPSESLQHEPAQLVFRPSFRVVHGYIIPRRAFASEPFPVDGVDTTPAAFQRADSAQNSPSPSLKNLWGSILALTPSQKTNPPPPRLHRAHPIPHQPSHVVTTSSSFTTYLTKSHSLYYATFPPVTVADQDLASSNACHPLNRPSPSSTHQLHVVLIQAVDRTFLVSFINRHDLHSVPIPRHVFFFSQFLGSSRAHDNRDSHFCLSTQMDGFFKSPNVERLLDGSNILGIQAGSCYSDT